MSIVCRDSLNLSSPSPLDGLEKQECPQCKRRRMFFCYDCRLLMKDVYSPQVTLPCEVDVIKHPKEKNSKSTAIHCKIVAPSQTRVFHVPDVPNYEEEQKEGDGSIVLVFPSPQAVSVEDFVRSNGPIRKFVVLDCTWFQVGIMQKIPQIKGLPCVSLKSYRTAFWRPQYKKDDYHLATIEAIYYSLKEYVELGLKKEYKGDFDDLLFWFLLMRDKVDAREDAYLKRKAEEEKEQEKERDVEKQTDKGTVEEKKARVGEK